MDNIDDDFFDQLIRRKRSKLVKKSSKKKMNVKKHTYMAYWILSSFSLLDIFVQNRQEIFFLGMHKSNVIKGREFRPTPTFGVVSRDYREALPMNHEDFVKLIAALIISSNVDDIQKKAKERLIELTRDRNNADLYTEFDFNTITYERAENIASKNPRWKIPIFNPNNVSWLNTVFSRFIRIGPDHDKQVRQMILVGRDVKNLIPVIALVKPRYDFYHQIPLADGGLSLLVSLQSLIYARPNPEIAIHSPIEFERLLLDEINRLKHEDYTSFKLTIPLTEMIKQLTAES
jgi:hypothetical protein